MLVTLVLRGLRGCQSELELTRIGEVYCIRMKQYLVSLMLWDQCGRPVMTVPSFPLPYTHITVSCHGQKRQHCKFESD